MRTKLILLTKNCWEIADEATRIDGGVDTNCHLREQMAQAHLAGILLKYCLDRGDINPESLDS